MRLIDADDAKHIVKAIKMITTSRHNGKTMALELTQMYRDVVLRAIDDMPTIDPERHGYWLFTEYDYYNCSVCGEAYYNGCESTEQAKHCLENGDAYKYCPHCGARMDK